MFDNTHYILVDGEVVEESNLNRWGEWMQKNSRIVKQEERKGILVSTVFLGLNHNFGEGPPLLFETMVFPQHGPIDSPIKIGTGQFMESYCERYATLEEALAGHERAVLHAFCTTCGGTGRIDQALGGSPGSGVVGCPDCGVDNSES